MTKRQQKDIKRLGRFQATLFFSRSTPAHSCLLAVPHSPREYEARSEWQDKDRLDLLPFLGYPVPCGKHLTAGRGLLLHLLIVP